MFFRQKAPKDRTLSYLFGCGGIDKAAITHVIDTHVHADHYSGGRKLAQFTGARYCLCHSARINAA